MLERNYGVAGDDLAQQLTDVAGKLASEYWDEHQQDFRYIVDGSFLEEYDDYNIEVQFKSAATVSIAYALMSRCGLDTEQYFQHEDFMPIFDFNTPATVGALGAAVSQINQQVLRQIGVTVQHYEREQLAERSVTQDFMREIIHQGVEKCSSLAQQVLDQLEEDLTAALQEKLEQSQQQLERTKQELSALAEAAGDGQQQEKLKAQAELRCAACDLTEELFDREED